MTRSFLSSLHFLRNAVRGVLHFAHRLSTTEKRGGPNFQCTKTDGLSSRISLLQMSHFVIIMVSSCRLLHSFCIIHRKTQLESLASSNHVMDSLRAMAVRREGCFQRRIECFMTSLGLVFVNEFIPQLNARKESFPISARDFRCKIHAERCREALTVASGNFLIAVQDQDAIDIGSVFDKKLQIPLAGADELRISAEIRKWYGKPTLGFAENPEELI
jgi:hypothetical protein